MKRMFSQLLIVLWWAGVGVFLGCASGCGRMDDGRIYITGWGWRIIVVVVGVILYNTIQGLRKK